MVDRSPVVAGGGGVVAAVGEGGTELVGGQREAGWGQVEVLADPGRGDGEPRIDPLAGGTDGPHADDAGHVALDSLVVDAAELGPAVADGRVPARGRAYFREADQVPVHG